MMPVDFKIIPRSPKAQRDLQNLVVSTLHFPAHFLAKRVGFGLESLADADSAGEHLVIIDTTTLVIGFMTASLRFLGISSGATDNTVDWSPAIETTKRPDALLFMRSILMCKVRAALPNTP